MVFKALFVAIHKAVEIGSGIAIASLLPLLHHAFLLNTPLNTVTLNSTMPAKSEQAVAGVEN
jgi:hypothetical protein